MQTFERNPDGNAVGNLLFLVHGYNEGITDVVTMHDNIAAGLAGKLACTIVSSVKNAVGTAGN
jgi:hypothetical protein